MIGTMTGSVLADLVRHGTGAPPASPLTTALIGSGASLLMTRDKRPAGLLLLVAGGLLLWREAAAARRDSEVLVRRVRPGRSASGPTGSAPHAGASVAAA